jgi:hypothetical protein
MKIGKLYVFGLAVLAGLSPSLSAQVPAVPTPPAAGAGLGAVSTATGAAGQVTGAAGQASNLWSFLCPTPGQLAAKKEWLCNTPIGQLMNNTLKPVGALTGGLLGNCCPPVNSADLNKPPDSAEGQAARIKKEEAEAKARREAVRYLSTVDCHWFPDAQDALIKSLRKDSNECVRWEAAWGLGRGCCCTKKIIVALTDTVSGGDKLGFKETSLRVRAAAAASLEHCLSCYPPPPAEVLQKPPEAPKTGPEASANKTPPPAEAAKPKEPTLEDVLRDARKALADYYCQAHEVAGRRVCQGDDCTLYAILSGARRHHHRLAKNQVCAEEGGEVLPMPTTSEQPPVEELKEKPKEAPKEKPKDNSATSAPQALQKPATITPQALQKPAAFVPEAMPKPATSVSQVAIKPAVARPEPGPAPVVMPQVAIKPAVARPEPNPAPAVTQTVYAPSAMIMSQQTAPPGAQVRYVGGKTAQEWLTSLNSSAYPEIREFAVGNLSAFDWRTNPQIVAALLNAAFKDRTPFVRVACVRCLAKMDVRTASVFEALRKLEADPDLSIRSEAYSARVKLTSRQVN